MHFKNPKIFVSTKYKSCYLPAIVRVVLTMTARRRVPGLLHVWQELSAISLANLLIKRLRPSYQITTELSINTKLHLDFLTFNLLLLFTNETRCLFVFFTLIQKRKSLTNLINIVLEHTTHLFQVDCVFLSVKTVWTFCKMAVSMRK